MGLLYHLPSGTSVKDVPVYVEVSASSIFASTVTNMARVNAEPGENLEADVPDMLGLFNGRKLVKDVLPVDAVATERINRQIANAKRGEVLKEVRALTRVNLEAIESCLYNNLRSTDVTPLHRNAEPRVAASPTTRSDEEVRTRARLNRQESSVNLLNLFGNRRVV